MTNSPAAVRRRLLTIVYVLSIVGASAVGANSWIHEISGTINPSPDFGVETVTEENGQLIGRGHFRPAGSVYTTQINGVETSDRKFWPNVVAEVSDNVERDWRKIAYVTSGKPVSLSFSSLKANAMLYFNLDCFRNFLGKSQYGRFSLENGRVTVFRLAELQADGQTNVQEPNWMATTLGGGWPDSLLEGPFVVSGVAFQDGRLRIIATYSDSSADSRTVISGSRTYADDGTDEIFWADATLEVSNDPGGGWQPVGKAQTPGKPGILTIESSQSSNVTISVCVDALRPLIAEFGYGRVVLKNGKAAAFRMKDLLPAKQRR